MEAVGQVNHRVSTLSSSRPIIISSSYSTLSFSSLSATTGPTTTLHPHCPLFSRHNNNKLSLSIRASASSSSSSSPADSITPPFSLLKSTLITGIAAITIFFFSRFQHPKSLLAISAVPPPQPSSSSSSEHVLEQEQKEEEEGEGETDSDSVAEALKKLMEERIKDKKLEEAIGIVDQLIQLQPYEVEWPLMKAHLYCYDGQTQMAISEFNHLISIDPIRVEAYHGLVMAASEGDSGEQLKQIQKRVSDAMEICRRNNKKDDLRDFKLLLAQIRVIEGNYNEALNVYQELVREEPRDFRPYLCQGIIYTLLRKSDEAEKQFEKYRRLVPKGHPYAQYFDDNMIATKVFGQKVENDRATFRTG